MITFAGRATRFALTSALVLSLQFRWAAAQHSTTAQNESAELSNVLTLTVGGHSRQISSTDLSRMPQERITVHNTHSDRDETYTGVALSELLRAGGLLFSKETQATFLRSYLRAEGTDFYFVIYSASEITPDLSNCDVIVATQVNGHDLGREGRFKLVSTGDKRPARWVRNLLSISLVTLN